MSKKKHDEPEEPELVIEEAPKTVTDPDEGPAFLPIDAIQRKYSGPSAIVALHQKLFRVCSVRENTVSLQKIPAEGDNPAVPYSYYELRAEIGLRHGVDFPPLKLVNPLPIPDETA